MNVPPVEGWRATSPREVEKVESSSCASFVQLVVVFYLYRQDVRMPPAASIYTAYSTEW